MSDTKLPEIHYTERVYPCKIVGVIDGDTVVVDIDRGHGQWSLGEKIRLRLSDAAEMSSTDPKLQQMAQLARLRVQECLPVGSSQQLRTYYTPKSKVEEREKFGRFQGDFFLYGKYNLYPELLELRFLTGLLFHQNLTVPYKGDSKAKIQAKHLHNWEYHELNGSFSVLT